MESGSSLRLCGLKGKMPRLREFLPAFSPARFAALLMVQMDDAGVLVAENGVINIMDTSTGCKIVDYSGATSFFTGVLAAELVKNKSIPEAAIKAHRAALLCMEKVGVYSSFPSAETLTSL